MRADTSLPVPSTFSEKCHVPLYTPAPYDEQQRLRVQDLEIQHSLLIYRDLEDDLDTFCRSVPAVEAHLGVYSTKLWGIILRSCSEVDSQLHSLVSTDKSATTTIRDYVSNEAMLQLSKFTLLTRFSGIQVTPFDTFARGKSPNWWTDYNAVKHSRLDTLQRATLRNTINAVGALHVVLFRQYGEYLLPRRLTLMSGHQVAETSSSFFSLHKAPWDAPSGLP